MLDERLKAVSDGEGHLVLIAGEPGVGKTRLAEDVVARSGMSYAWGRATEAEGSPPYWPFRQVVRAIGGASTVWEPPAGGADSAQERFRLFEAVTELLIAAAEPDALVVVFDDLQWADPASVQLLVHLARAVARSKLLVIGTFRHTETTGRAALRGALSTLASEPAVTRLTLAGLTEPEVAAQLAGVTGWPVPASVAAAICRRTSGNPFFVGELGRLLAGSADGDELPAGVRDAVRGRLGRLSPLCRAMLAEAAVLGAELDPEAIAAATERSLAEVLAALDEAIAAGIVEGGRFAHDLIREAARLDVGTVERLALHQRMAGYLRGLGDADVRVGQIAEHLLESLPAGGRGRGGGVDRTGRRAGHGPTRLGASQCALWPRAGGRPAGPVAAGRVVAGQGASAGPGSRGGGRSGLGGGRGRDRPYRWAR
ncbi:ATP-binding protein [Fodinicola feengrottensis]|uniref:ATP-binding protein n=1 Tax=Fodinicola feengrottensis TaxID=435914 RepID=UPI0028BE1A4D|nr:AAA family ATPase [Fodinicola feengrottensis]